MDSNSLNPFNYDLNLSVLPGTGERSIICMHGSGANFTIANTIRSLNVTDATLVSFNFPDYDLTTRPQVSWPTFGTIEELLPALYVLKTCIIEKNMKNVDFYGFSAGGAALTNAIGLLNRTDYDEQLEKIGIGPVEKDTLISAIEKGTVLLDCPLKSIEEIIYFRGPSPELEIHAGHYLKNQFRPIDALKFLEGIQLKIILYFELPDEIIFNRDDALYIKHLAKANSEGRTYCLSGNSGGHCAPHLALWHQYTRP